MQSPGKDDDLDGGQAGERVAGEKGMIYLVTAMRKKIELEPGGIPVKIQLPEHVCGVMFVYDDLAEAQRIADMTPGATIGLIELKEKDNDPDST